MRNAIAVVTVLLLGAAAVFWVQDDSTTAGIMARLGFVMAAVWLAYPVVTEVGARSWLFLGIAMAVVALRPRSALIVLPVLAFAMRRRTA